MGTTQDRDGTSAHTEPERPTNSINHHYDIWRDDDILEHFQHQRDQEDAHTRRIPGDNSQGLNNPSHRNTTMLQ
eukprot:11289870-Heterocapsa_arctica.AAC.1